MLYLLLDTSKDKCFAKVGYTSDRHKSEDNPRIKQYRTHNASFILKDWHAGNKQDESSYHNKLIQKSGSVKIKRNEWVEVSEDFYNQLLIHGFDAI